MNLLQIATTAVTLAVAQMRSSVLAQITPGGPEKVSHSYYQLVAGNPQVMILLCVVATFLVWWWTQAKAHERLTQECKLHEEVKRDLEENRKKRAACEKNLLTAQEVQDYHFCVLKQTIDPVVAARSAIHTRRPNLELERLLQAFSEADDELVKGHMALMLGERESGDERDRAVEVLKPHLANESSHVRYLAALALDTLNFEDRADLDDLLKVEISSGEYTTMGLEPKPGPDEKKEPAWRLRTERRVHIEAFRIDRFPLVNAQYSRFVSAGGYKDDELWSEEGKDWKDRRNISRPNYFGDPRFSIPSAPVVGISAYEAEAYAKWAGKRLPTDREWERAARGDVEERKYPWDGPFEPGKCNVGYVGQSTPVGSFPQDFSPHGCYDMAGNVQEWTHISESNQTDWYLCGSSWVDRFGEGLARCSTREWYPPMMREHSVGVRLAKSI